MLGVLCLLTMPQSYTGGSPVAHPHAIFQFWIPSGHISADDHHGEEMDAATTTGGHGGHHSGATTSTPSMADERAEQAERDDVTTNRPVVDRAAFPGLAVVTASTLLERGDLIGGVLEPWFVLFLVALAGLFVTRNPLSGRSVMPDLPPPRLTIASP